MKKIYHRLIATITMGLILLLSNSAAFAGGWAVITIDSLPGEIRVGEAFTIEFSVRQHGVTPMSGLEPTISAQNPETGEMITFTAEPGAETGDYTATLKLPTVGQWSWSVQAFTMDQAMPALEVLPSSLVELPERPPTNLAPFLLTGASLLGLLVAFQAFRTQRARWGYGLAALSLAIGLFAVLGFSYQSGGSAQAAEKTGNLATAVAGKDLFISKGCLTCHDHSGVNIDGTYYRVSEGPNLSKFTGDPDYLRRWLSNPQAVKPDTYMPNLELSDSEIEALIVFLNAK